MSRIGKKPVAIPDGVTVDVQAGNLVTVKGPKGTLSQQVDPEMKIEVEGSELTIDRPNEQKKFKSMHGLYRSLIFNMVEGVTDGYKKQLELVGVGFRASTKGNLLELNLGYSHNIFFQVPEELTVIAETQKGKNPTITLEGIDKQLIGYVAAKIKSLRKVEPYKGKGVRFVGEVIRRKAGKAAGK
ncbi:50S ribosomal protein L6 [Rapidithrix thailandica]|uniref:Large ribosomal subunit protein uL6 n=1 Tax=Rapidithrix thailandica TaxID=413964 RepID=A0AAW9S2C7_9BACT